MMAKTVGVVIRPTSVVAYQVTKDLFSVKTKMAPVAITGTEDAQVVEAIRTALASLGTPTGQVAVSVPAKDVLLRSFTLPLIPRSEWESAIQFEARKYLPFKTEQLVWNCHVVEQRSAKQLTATFVGMRTEVFARLQGWLKAAGVAASSIEAQAVSLARVVSPPKEDASTFVGIVEVDEAAEVAHLVIAKDHVPLFAREMTLKTDQEAGAAQESVDHRAQALFSELRLSIDFFTREHPSLTMGQLVVFGQRSTIEPWLPWLADHLHCPVVLGVVPSVLKSLGADGGAQAAVMGLALRELLHRHLVNMDLMERPAVPERVSAGKKLAAFSTEWTPEVLQRDLLKPLMAQLVMGAIVLGALVGIGRSQVAIARQSLVNTVQAFPDPGWGLKGKGLQELKGFQQQVEGRVAFLGETLEHRVSVTEKLDALARSLPEGVWLEGLTYEGALQPKGSERVALTIRGACFLGARNDQELETINEFVRRIRGSPQFLAGLTSIQVAGITAQQPKRVAQRQYSYKAFQVKCQSTQERL